MDGISKTSLGFPGSNRGGVGWRVIFQNEGDQESVLTSQRAVHEAPGDQKATPPS